MNQLAAFRDTVTLAQEHGMADISGFADGCDYWHIQHMLERATAENLSEAKLGRWLGWAQGVVVAAAIGITLEDMKELNKRHVD